MHRNNSDLGYRKRKTVGLKNEFKLDIQERKKKASNAITSDYDKDKEAVSIDQKLIKSNDTSFINEPSLRKNQSEKKLIISKKEKPRRLIQKFQSIFYSQSKKTPSLHEKLLGVKEAQILNQSEIICKKEKQLTFYRKESGKAIKILKQDIECLNKQLSDCYKDNTKLSLEKQSIEKSLAKQIDEKKSMENVLTKLNQEKQSIEKSLIQHNHDKKSMKRTLDKLRSEKQSIEESLTQYKHDKMSMKKTLNELSLDKQSIEKTLAQHSKQYKELEMLYKHRYRNDLLAFKAYMKKGLSPLFLGSLLMVFLINCIIWHLLRH